MYWTSNSCAITLNNSDGSHPHALELKRPHRSRSIPSAFTSADGDTPVTTDGPGSALDSTDTPEGSTSRTDSSTELVIRDDTDALSSPSNKMADPVTAPSTSSSTNALTAPPASEQRLDGRTTLGNTAVAIKSKNQWVCNGPHEHFQAVNMTNKYATCHSLRKYTADQVPHPLPIHPKTLRKTNWQSKNKKRPFTAESDTNNDLKPRLKAAGILTRLLILRWWFKVDWHCTPKKP